MILTINGHVEIAKTMINKEYWLAFGETTEEWDYPPAEDLNATDLEKEVGRVRELAKFFVEADDSGSVELLGKKWSIVNYPTSNIYLKFILNAEQLSDKTIRQLGIFVDAIPANNNDSTFLTPEQLENKGVLLFYENAIPIRRNAVTKQIHEYVLQF